MDRREAARDVSFVIEWHNVLLAESERAVRMLRHVDRQAAHLRLSAEVILVHDTAAAGATHIDPILERAGLRGRPSLPVVRVGRPGLYYYGMKNAGALHARGSIVVFVDSDVIPQDDWLRALLEPFDDPLVQVVAGSTSVGPLDTVYNKTFAIAWMFNPPVDLNVRSGPEVGRWFHGNNVAFRREAAARYPWPDVGGLKRQNEALHAQLAAEGVRVMFASRARCEHPAPSGLSHMARYAYSGAYDRAYPRLGPLPKRLLWVLATPAAFAKDTLDGFSRVLPRSRRRAVGMRAMEVPAALGIVLLYAGLRAVGFVLAMVVPGLIPRRLST